MRLQAGVSVGALNHHFAGKAALLEALYLRLIDDFQTGFVAELRSHSDAEEGVKSGVRFYLRWVARNRSGAAILFSAALMLRRCAIRIAGSTWTCSPGGARTCITARCAICSCR